MPLLDIPPYVLADEDPPTTTTRARGFLRRSYQILEPIDFPRELFADALAEHARLLRDHGAEMLAAPLDHPGDEPDDRFVPLVLLHCYAMLLIRDEGAREMHRWRAVGLSYVVQRCRGIVRRLMEEPPPGHCYAVVVSHQVASLQLVRGVEPRRAGDAATLEVVEPDLVVEPWDQWHERAGKFCTTWWRTPAGDLVASRVPIRPWPTTARAIVDALLTLRGRSLRARIDAYRREEPRGKVFAVVETGVRGEELRVLDRREASDYVQPFPGIAEALRVRREGLDPVLVDLYSWAALCWLTRETSNDVAVPEPLLVERVPRPDDQPDDEDEEEVPPDPPLRLTPTEHYRARFDEFAALEPWAPTARDVHRVWKAGLSFGAFLAMAAAVAGALLSGLARSLPEYAAAGVLIVLALATAGLMSAEVREALHDLDPVRRERRWRAWKQVRAEMDRARRPRKPKPPVYGRKYWMKRMAMRLSRLERLAQLDAPPSIIDNGRKLIRDAMAKLDRSDADAVLAAWPEGARLLEPRAALLAGGKKGTDKPN